MAKGIRSKRLQRTLALKREAVRKVIHPQQFQRLGTTHVRPKNAFLHPNDPDAIFPQHVIPAPIDFRSDAITPFAVPIKSQRLFQSRQPLPERDVVMTSAPMIEEEEDLSLTELKHTLGNIEKNIKKKAKMRLA